MTDNIFQQHFLLDAEAAANAWLDDPNLAYRQPQKRGDHTPGMERYLGAGADDQSLIFVPPTDGDVRFDGRLLYLMDIISALKNMVGFFEALLHVAQIGFDVMDDVAVGIVDI